MSAKHRDATPWAPATQPAAGPAAAAAGARAAHGPENAARSRARSSGLADSLMYLAMAAMLAGAYVVSRAGLYDARSDVGYWIGVAGAVMLLLLFAYPLRKRSALLTRWGKAKYWFVVHMVLGILGPVLVLAHSAFRVGSLNAGVALFSMLTVAASGVIGRFIYLRVHQGLGGQLQTLESLQQSMLASAAAAGGPLQFAPDVVTRVQALQSHCGTPRDDWHEHARRLLVLPWQIRAERKSLRQAAQAAVKRAAQNSAWTADTLRARERSARSLVDSHCAAVLRAAQLAAYARLFSLWHVLHVPFVFLMVICAIAHVVAVHAY